MKSLKKPCLDCGRLTQPGKSRCPEHSRQVRKSWDRQAVLNRRARMATGDGGASRLRYRVNAQGGASCVRCSNYYPAGLIRIDHTLRLADGGLDVDDNVEAMCHLCHRAKTIAEQRK